MTIEITRPETEALSQQCLQSGQFHDVDELPVQALAALKESEASSTSEGPSDREHSGRAPPKSLVEVCAMVRGLTDDVDFSRDPSTGRPVDLDRKSVV